MRLSARQVYDKLMNEEKILELQGEIRFFLGDVNIVVKQKDVVGNLIQEWLGGWFVKRDIEHALGENSQMPPDFFLDTADRTKELLEVKAFNRSASPGFDIADFRMYAEEVIDKPFMLDVNYLIFGYDMRADGIVTIKDLWLKKVWEITRRMGWMGTEPADQARRRAQDSPWRLVQRTASEISHVLLYGGFRIGS